MIEEDKIKTSVIIAGMVIFLAYTKQYVYYYYFNIDVSNYISLQEVFTPFIENIVYCMMYFFLIMITMFIDWNPEKTTDVTDTKKENDYKINFKVIIGCLCGIIFLIIIKQNWISYLIFIPFIILNSIIILFKYKKTELISFSNKNQKLFLQYQTMFFIFCVFLFSLTITFFALGFDITIKLQNEFKRKSYVFEFDENKITTDSSKVYLGRTLNKIFFLDRTNINHKVEIYNTSDIKKEFIIELKQK